MAFNHIVFRSDYDESIPTESGRTFVWQTHSKVNKHITFCTELNCSNESQLSGRRCESCERAACRDCGTTFSIGLAIDSTRCPTCIMNRNFPCMSSEVCRFCNRAFKSLNPSFVCHPCGGDSSSEYVRTVDDIREDIVQIQEKLSTRMTSGQRADWVHLLNRRRAALAKTGAPMWEGY